MESARKIPVIAPRCLNGHNCPPDKSREAEIKELLVQAKQRKRANQALNALMRERRCGLSGLLGITETWVATGRLSAYVFERLLDRLEEQRRRNALSEKEKEDLEKAKSSPARQPK